MPHPLAHIGKFFLIPFFTIHYGGFTAAHGLFVLIIFKKNVDFNSMQGESWPCFLVFIQILFNVVKQIYSIIPTQIKFAILGLFISHGISFIYNYLHKKEYITAKPQQLMIAPYGRVIVMHFTILGGAFVSMTLGSPAAILLLLVVLKIIVDIIFHFRGHQKVQINS